MRMPEFLENATNVYRTKKYIVKQDVYLEYDKCGNNRVFSKDIFFFEPNNLIKNLNTFSKIEIV